MGKIRKSKGKNIRSGPLEEQIIDRKYALSSSRVKSRYRLEEDEFVDDKLTKKILSQAKRQQKDLQEEVGASGFEQLLASKLFSHLNVKEDDDTEELNLPIGGADYIEEEIKISPEDERALERFNCKDPVKCATLADVIKEKLSEKKTEIASMYSEVGSMTPKQLETILPHYCEVGEVLSRYRSGRLPKPFKWIPQFPYWEELVHITDPDRWSAASMYQATRIFASNLNGDKAQRFYNLVLLPRLRDDIAECKMLNFHLYQALVKAVFKPAAFFKGIILPLCESRTCTLREATILGSVMAKCSIPVLHSSAALLRIAEMEYSGANSVFMRVLIEKKYALPFRVIDGVVEHFRRFLDDDRELPLLWHQCLLTFVQLYKNDLLVEQQRELLRLLTVHHHEFVSPEIRRELQSGACRNTQPAMETS